MWFSVYAGVRAEQTQYISKERTELGQSLQRDLAGIQREGGGKYYRSLLKDCIPYKNKVQVQK